MESMIQKAFENVFEEEKKEEKKVETHQSENSFQGLPQEVPEVPALEPVHNEMPAAEQPLQETPAFDAGVPAVDEKTFEQKVNEEFDLDAFKAKILVVGTGGGGNNCVTRLTDIGVKGAETVAINTDAKHLAISRAHKKVLLGKDLTKGLGAGGYPNVGKKAAEESEREIKKMLEGIDMLYLVTGLGGGTGTGSSPVIAKIAKEMGAIVIASVTMPFKVEGARMGKAEDGLYQLRQVCDTVIVIENDRLLKIAGNLPLQQAFAVADDLIANMIKGITETISQPSLVNLDYADVKTIMHSGGVATVGFGESDTKNRAEECIIKAMTNPLLEVDYQGGTGALIHMTGGDDLRLDEVNMVGEYVSNQLDPEAQVMWGARIDPAYNGKLKVITIITGVKSPYILGPVAKQEQEGERNINRELGIPVWS